MKSLFLIILISLSAAFAGPREEASEQLEKLSALSGIQRLERASTLFLGLPYAAGGPLGEGENGRYDQDPLYRFDTFDCTTFVETIVSLALAGDVDEFEQMMDKIRYKDSQVDYLTRNHYTDLQWVPYNVENGLLVEVNDLVLPSAQQLVAEALIDFPNWLRKIKLEQIRIPMATTQERQDRLAELQALADQFQPRVARLRYLPISTLIKRPELLQRIPNGAIVNWVRPNWDLTDVAGTHQNVSHQGFIFKKNSVVVMRHASISNGGKVIEDNLLNYLKRYENHATMKGIHLMVVQGL